jgi:hypothetical protein
MNALRDRSRSIQFEAFHIFKIFAANPNKHPEVLCFAFCILLLSIVTNVPPKVACISPNLGS